MNRCRRHKFSTAYCLRVDKKETDEAKAKGEPEPEAKCRFKLPGLTRLLAILLRLPGKTWWHFRAERNDPYMNQFNPQLALCWLANTDIFPYTSVEAVINQAAKYCGREEAQTSTYVQIAKSILPHIADNNPMLSFISKLMNKLVGERDYSP